MRIKIKKLHPDAVIPTYATPGSAGFDLVASEDVSIAPGQTVVINTGLSFQIPEGYELQIRGRSGLSLKTNLRIHVGTIDADFRGEVGAIASNASHYRMNTSASDNYAFIANTIHIKKGERIAQGIIAPIVQGRFELAEELTETERGGKGFGSSGV